MDSRNCIYFILLYNIGVFIKPTFQNTVHHHHTQHGVILDAGSSSIKVRIYKWTHNIGDKHMNVPLIHLVNSKRIKISLSKFARQPDMLELQLMNAVDMAVQYINDTVHHEVDLSGIPIYLLSTAGTRTLSSHDARYFVRTVRRLMSNSTINPFYFKHRHAQILSGEEEGVYSWLSINYLLGFFNVTGPSVTPVGILEMGGGSTQIAFIPHDPLFDGEFHIYMAKRRYELYVHSYLNYGQNYIKDRVNKWLLRHHHGNSTRIADPCRLEGDERKLKHHNGTRILYGTGNVTQCHQIVNTFLKKADDDTCSPKPCAIGTVYQPHVSNITFYAVGAFKYAPSDLGALEQSKRLNIGKLQELTELQCAKNFSTVIKKKKRYASEYCLMGVYVSLLLTKAYGFSENTTGIIVSDRINGTKTDWSLGFILHEVMEQQTLTPFKPVVEIHCPNLGLSMDTVVDNSASSYTRQCAMAIFTVILNYSFTNLVILSHRTWI